MARQVFRHRLPAGFGDGVRVTAKTGTLPGLHNEVGVAEFPDGGRYAVAVFARTPDLVANHTQTDVAIGTAARTAVDLLRGSRSGQAVRPGVMRPEV
jgi:beta-lactamase class A